VKNQLIKSERERESEVVGDVNMICTFVLGQIFDEIK
jgi:hypothetical protein